METHSFAVQLATSIGLEESLLLQQLSSWTAQNSQNENLCKDGYVWTYASIRTLRTLFPYLTEHKIRSAMDSLIQQELVVLGDYKFGTMLHTKSYALTEKSLEILGREAYTRFDKSANRFDKNANRKSTLSIDSNLSNSISENIIKEANKDNKDTINTKEVTTNPNRKENIKRKELPLPFDCPEIRALWVQLMDYPNWKKKTDWAIQLRIKTLERLCPDQQTAIASITQTLQKGWEDFYLPKGEFIPKVKETAREKKTPWEEMGITEEQYHNAFKK